jgi:hypothetical protein
VVNVRFAWHSCMADHRERAAGLMRRRPARVCPLRSGFAGFRFSPEVIMVAIRWYLRYGSYRDVEELLAERGIDVDHVTVCRWVQRFTPLVIDAGPGVLGRWPGCCRSGHLCRGSSTT